MKHHKVRRTALLALATAFLVAAWIWDGLAAIGRTLVAIIPWKRFKAAFVALIDRLPAPIALIFFLVPFLIVEPLLVVATVAIAMGYVFSGAAAWIVLKALAIGVIPAIFDLTKHRLMTMPWFVWCFERVTAFHHYADRIVAPYRHAAARIVARARLKAAAVMGRTPGAAQLAARFARRRAANGRPFLSTGE
jgi:hypothetical protein